MSKALALILDAAFDESFLSQTQFGKLIGDMPQQTVSVYLLGEKSFEVEVLVAMCRVLMLDPEEVFSDAIHATE